MNEIYRATPPGKDPDRQFQKLSLFFRADCAYELGNFEEAIKLYDTAALRYQEDPSALAAYVTGHTLVVDGGVGAKFPYPMDGL